MNRTTLQSVAEIVNEAYTDCQDEIGLMRNPERQFLLLLKTLAWPDIEAAAIAECRRKVGLE